MKFWGGHIVSMSLTARQSATRDQPPIAAKSGSQAVSAPPKTSGWRPQVSGCFQPREDPPLFSRTGLVIGSSQETYDSAVVARPYPRAIPLGLAQIFYSIPPGRWRVLGGNAFAPNTERWVGAHPKFHSVKGAIRRGSSVRAIL